MGAAIMIEQTGDGRHARRERNRTAVVDALLALYREGHIAPSTDEIADRAGVSARSLFRYFDDVDDLCRVTIARQHAHLAPLSVTDIDPSLPFPTRVEAFVRHRIALYRATGWVGVVARARATHQPLIAAELTRLRTFQREHAAQVFVTELQTAEHESPVLPRDHDAAEHESLPRDHDAAEHESPELRASAAPITSDELLAAVDTLCSFESFCLLAGGVDGDHRQTERILIAAVSRLLGPAHQASHRVPHQAAHQAPHQAPTRHDPGGHRP